MGDVRLALRPSFYDNTATSTKELPMDKKLPPFMMKGAPAAKKGAPAKKGAKPMAPPFGKKPKK